MLKRGKTYKYSINKIIDVLEITADEMRDLNLEYLYTRTPEEKKEHKSKYDSERYIKNKNEKGEKTKSEEIKERAEAVAELIAKGKSKKEIREELKISSSAYDRARVIAVKDGLLERALTAVREAAKKIIIVAKEKTENIKEAIAKAGERLEKAMKTTTSKIPFAIVLKNNFVILYARVSQGWQEEVGENVGLRE